MGSNTGNANSLQGEFGEAWLEAVAAGSGLLHGRATTLDLQKADIHLVRLGEHAGTLHPAVNAQVKTTKDLRLSPEGDLVYDLDVDTYEVLRRDNHAVRRVLVVIGVSMDDERVRLQEDGTLLVGRSGWVSVEGRAATPNTETQVVRIPKSNTVDSPGLHRMLMTYGVRRSTPVPDLDLWEPR